MTTHRDAPRKARCARCSAELQADADGVFTCSWHGSFVRPEHAARLKVMLERIAESPHEALQSPEHGMGVHRCPGCEARVRALCFFEVPIDWCPSCGGIWLDRGELELLRESIAALRSAVRDDQLNPYRTHAAAATRAMVLGTTTCAECQAKVVINETLVTGNGVFCLPCGRARAGELPSSEDEEEVSAWLDGREPEHQVPASWLTRALRTLLDSR